MYKSTDGGRTWVNVGLSAVRNFSKIRIHPTNPDIVYASAMGDIFGATPERGVFRTKDGGKTWQRVLFKSNRAAAFAMPPAVVIQQCSRCFAMCASARRRCRIRCGWPAIIACSAMPITSG